MRHDFVISAPRIAVGVKQSQLGKLQNVSQNGLCEVRPVSGTSHHFYRPAEFLERLRAIAGRVPC